MVKENIRLCLLLILFMTPLGVNATSTSSHLVVVPTCLIKDTAERYQILATENNFNLIKTNETGINELAEAKEKKRCGGFIDVTLDWQTFSSKHANKAKAFLTDHLQEKPLLNRTKQNYSIQYPTQVNQVLSQLNSSRMWSDLTTFSAFPDRYYQTDNGLKAAEWIHDTMQTIAGNRSDVSIYYVPTSNYKQPSVVVKWGTSNLPGIVIGGHMDSTRGIKPGADDDGTGTVTVLETARVLLNSGLHFKKPIYFIWYAAEEVGLVGSQYVVRDFKNKKIPVSEVMQLDMTGYPDKTYPTAIWLMDDNVSQTLTAYLESLINAYVKKPIKHSSCGYGCSDHATWYKNGYNACIPFEASMSTYNPYIHTSQDTIEKLILTHMTDYAKLALAFAVELAEPI